MIAARKHGTQTPTSWKIKNSVSSCKPSLTQARPIPGAVSNPKPVSSIKIRNAGSSNSY